MRRRRPLRLLDTNICPLPDETPAPRVAERFARRRVVGEVLVSAITAAEWEYGVAASEDQAERNRLVSRIRDEAGLAARCHGGRGAGTHSRWVSG